MRVTSNNFSDNLVSNFHRLARRQLDLQNQIATGQRISAPSDDPIAAQQVLQLRDDSVANAQFQKNIGTHQEFATVTHGLMRNLQKVLDRAEEIAVSIDDIDSDEDLKTYAAEVNQLLEHALQIANAQHRGEFILGGTKSDSEPFTSARGVADQITSVTFVGNTNVAESEIAPGTAVASRVPGENRSGSGERGLFADSGAGADIFAHLISLRDQLASGDITNIAATRDQLLADEENVIFNMAKNGALQSRLETSLSSAKDESLALENEISSRADVDMAEAIVHLNQQQTNYQAALQSASSTMNLSLLSFLR
jgi:flagellar hook-associated protein 3 FlgL